MLGAFLIVLPVVAVIAACLVLAVWRIVLAAE